jgi:hypothetical protein
MDHLKIEVSFPDINAIFDRYDRDGKGSIDYKEFLDLLNMKPSSSSSSSDKRHDPYDLVMKFREKIEYKLGPGAHAAKRLKEVIISLHENYILQF